MANGINVEAVRTLRRAFRVQQRAHGRRWNALYKKTGGTRALDDLSYDAWEVQNAFRTLEDLARKMDKLAKRKS